MAFKHLRSRFNKKHSPRNDATLPESAEISPDSVVIPPPGSVNPPQNGVVLPRNGAIPTHKGQIGLFQINQIETKVDGASPGERYSVDVVAIHGITGDAFNTWTHKNGTNWLKDYLPAALPGARIFTYGYPADVLWTRSTGDIDDFARSLLNGLVRERRQLEVHSRPIILICHSMGGIVAKRALIMARNDDVDYGDIHKSVYAVLFLSTPHQGAGITSLLDLPLEVVNFASYASLPVTGFFKSAAGKPRKDLVKALQKESTTLEKISTDFRSSRKNIKITSFIEMEIMPGLHKVVVDKLTGVMHIDHEVVVPMHGCDHTTVCRFENASCEGYKNIVDVLKAYATEARENATNFLPEDISCLKTLAFLEMKTRRSEADNAYPTTCEWILLHKSYTEWLSSLHGLLWIKGMPGSGKSTLLAFVYRTLQDSCRGQSELRLEFFFHGRGEKLQKTPVGMFRSLAHQMFTKDYTIRQPLRNLFHEKAMLGDVGTGWEWQYPELRQILFDAILTAAKSRKVLIFIDALDEAGPDAPVIIRFFHDLNDRISATHSTAKICISCRHYPVTANIPGLDVVVEDHNSDDIAKYVRATLGSEVRREHGDLDSDTWYELEERIIQKSARIFQWAHLVIPIVLDHYHDGASKAEIFRMLATVPEKLEDVYEYILSKIIKPCYRKRTLHLMQWIFLAERPLTITEIRYAVACVDIPESQLPKTCADVGDFVESDDLMQLVVTSWSGGLAEVKNHEGKKIVQFIHQSVNDFFLVSGGLIFLESVLTGSTGTHNTNRLSRSSNGDIVGRSHDRLARSCITYLKLEEVQLCRILVTNLDHELLPFLDYTTKSWFLHAEKAERLGITQAPLIEQFASPPGILSKWIKTYNMIDEFSRYCPQEGANLLHVASGTNLRTTVTALLQQDADIEKEDSWGNRPLHYAIRRGHKELVEMLLSAGSLVSVRNRNEESPFMLAAEFGDLEVILMLLDKGADINDNALQAAARKGHLVLVRFLLQAGADVKKLRPQGMPLHYAANQGHEEIVEELLSHAADINARTYGYCTALQAAAGSGFGSNHMVQLLLEKGADVHAQGGEFGNALQAGAHTGNVATVRLLLDAGANAIAEGGLYGNALQAASESGQLDTIQLLIERGAKVNQQGGKYGTALQAAAYLDRNDAVEFLLEKGAIVNVNGGDYGSAIQAAAVHGNFDIMLTLIRNNADVNAQGGEWGNPLRAAFSKGHIHAAWLLLKNGAQDHMRNEEFNTTLKAVAAKGLQELRDFMVDKCPIESDRSRKLKINTDDTERGEAAPGETSPGLTLDLKKQ